MPKDIFTIKPVRRRQGGKQKPVKGKELVPDQFARMFLGAGSGSGKSTVINHLLKHTVDRRATVVIFSSTVDIDNVWKNSVNYLKKKKIPVFTFPHIIEEGVNMLECFLETIEEKHREPIEPNEPGKDDTPPKPLFCLFEEEIKEEQEDKPRKTRKINYKTRVPEYLLILDDISKEMLRSSSIYNLYKKARHYKTRVMVSSQGVLDVKPELWANFTDVYLWKGFSKTHMKIIHDRLPVMSMEFEDFYDLYLRITSEQYAFMNISVSDGKIRKKFSKLR